MKILRDNPKKSACTLTKEGLHINGHFVERVLSGYGNTGSAYGFLGKSQWNNDTKCVSEVEIPNPIFWARIKAVGTSRGRTSAVTIWEDEDEIHKYHSGVSSTKLILEGIQDGLLKAVNGYIEGEFTFKFQGSNSYLIPYKK